MGVGAEFLLSPPKLDVRVQPWLVIKLTSLVAVIYFEGEWLVRRSNKAFKSSLYSWFGRIFGPFLDHF